MSTQSILAELDRRRLLRYLRNAAVMAPFMQTIFETEAYGAVNAKRALFFFYPDGIDPDKFHPTAVGSTFDLPTITAPLGKVKSDIVLIKNSRYETTGSHEAGAKYCLTAADANTKNFQSIDTYLGAKLRGNTSLPVLRLGVGSNFQSGFDKTVSYLSSTSMATVDDNPREVFKRLFGGTTPDSSQSGPKTLGAKGQKSVLDFALEDLKSLQMRLGSIEKSKLNLHMESLRELERRTILAMDAEAGGSGGGTATAACTRTIDYRGLSIPESDSNYPKLVERDEHFGKLADIQVDLAIQAMACGLTNVVLIQLSHSVSPLTMNFVGGPGIGRGHHDISHFGSDSSDHAKSQAFFMGQYATIIEKMKAVKEGDKSLLYNAITMCVSDLGHSDHHAFENVGIVLGGQAGGLIKTGRVIDAHNEGHGKTLVSVLQAMGLSDTTFGTGQGALTGLIG